MSLTVKAFFKEEIRRFALDVTNAASFEILEGKIRAAFQSLPPKGKLLMKWKDSEGDLITFSSDEELVEALSSSDNGVFRVHLFKKENNNKQPGDVDAELWISNGFPGCPPNYAPPPPPPPHHGHPPPPPFGMPPHFGGPRGWGGMFGPPGEHEPVRHFGVTCDGCEMNPIVGNRYKCKSRHDFDLCSGCKDKEVTLGMKYEYEEITEPKCGWGAGGMFGFPPRGGGRCGRRGKWGMFRRFPEGEQSSGDENHGHRGGPMSKEEREKMQNILTTVKEAAKTQAYEVAGATAGDCAGEAVVIAVRSSIRRAMVVQRRSGLGPQERKKNKKHKEESTSSSDESDDCDFETIDEDSTAACDSKKNMKRKAKSAAKAVSKLAMKEVSESFGKLAGKWAAYAVRQSMLVSIKQCVKADLKREKKNARKEMKKNSVVTFAGDNQPMDGVSTSTAVVPQGVNESVNNQSGVQPLTMTVNNVPIYPFVAPETVPLYSAPPAPEPVAAAPPSSEEQAIMDAITAFKNMGFNPDEKLVDDIRKAKGDIVKVFDQMKK